MFWKNILANQADYFTTEDGITYSSTLLTKKKNPGEGTSF